MEGTQKFNIQKIPFRDEKYPERLKVCENMPEQLYLKGVFPENQKPTAAIVGARMCSPYGRIQTAVSEDFENRRRDSQRISGRNGGEKLLFSSQEPYHQWTGRSGADCGSKRKKRITDHSPVGTGTGKDSVCTAGTSK